VVAPAGGFGNSRGDLELAYGDPQGETPGRLVVFQGALHEYRVQFTPDPPRAMLLVRLLPVPMPLEVVADQARALLPRDAQPRAGGPEVGEAFVIQRFASASLAAALPESVFREHQGAPGEFVVVYPRDADGLVTQSILAVGNDPAWALNRADD
jgi:hypothetical protein